MKPFNEGLAAVAKALEDTTAKLMTRALQDPEEAGAAANDYLELFALVALAFMWCLQVRQALGDESPHAQAKLRTAHYFFAHVLPQYHALVRRIDAGKAAMMAFDAADFDTA